MKIAQMCQHNHLLLTPAATFGSAIGDSCFPFSHERYQKLAGSRETHGCATYPKLTHLLWCRPKFTHLLWCRLIIIGFPVAVSATYKMPTAPRIVADNTWPWIAAAFMLPTTPVAEAARFII